MKILHKTLSIYSFAFFTLFFAGVCASSCTTDKCQATACANGGTCTDGVCKCLPGFAGVNCDSTSKLNFLGTWTVQEVGTLGGSRSYSLSVQSDTPNTGVLIYNFYNYFHVLRANINGDTITIPNQQYQGKVVFGNGYICPTTTYGRYGAIVLKYEVVDTALQTVDDYGVYPLIDKSVASTWLKE